MKNTDFADEIIKRMNELIESSEDARKGIEAVCHTRSCVYADELRDHPTIQVGSEGMFTDIGMVGILNGMAGVIQGGKLDKYGHIAAVYDEGKLVRFRRTEECEPGKA